MARHNPVKQAIRDGQVVLGMYCDTLHPAIIEVMAKAGMDFVILDTEHNAYGIDRCTECVRAADASGITPLIRVYDNNPRLINKALEIGALGVVVPHVDTPELARQAVAATKYPPDGIRGVHPGTRASGYAVGPDQWDAAWRSANAEIMVVLQPMESLEGVANLEEIAAVPGVDLISLGVGDLSQVLGAPGRRDDPRVRAARESALAACQKQGVAAYALVGSAEDARSWYGQGVRVFVAGTDLGLVQAGSARLVEDFRRLP
ncbi:MAG: siderophore biosynthesis protein SbnG [Chloroflexota bacterium]|nr:siderophore biosynthesis protein SbnG [Chloroflexota bacterium]